VTPSRDYIMWLPHVTSTVWLSGSVTSFLDLLSWQEGARVNRLRRTDTDDGYELRAERDIEEGEEVLRSSAPPRPRTLDPVCYTTHVCAHARAESRVLALCSVPGVGGRRTVPHRMGSRRPRP
jgi:hypothetical protein